METHSVECLRCGDQREVGLRGHRPTAGECPRCGYLGWAPTEDLTETTRRVIRERPLEVRRLRPVW
jgi:hypothetical protein